MDTGQRNAQSLLFKGGLSLVATAAAALLGFSSAAAQVVLDDGKTYVIDDDTHEFDRIEVRGGSRLIIRDGAVIAASIGPAFEVAIHVFDDSKLVVQGGSFGGDRLGLPVPNFLDNWFSGSIAAFDEATVIIEGGTFGACAFRSGTTFVMDDATLFVSEGTFSAPGGSNSDGLQCQAGGGRIEVLGNASAAVSGGLHQSSINATDFSTVRISGGTHGQDTGGGRGVVGVSGFATLRISGGLFGAGGPVSGAVFVGGSATADISGGMYGGSGFRAGSLSVSDTAFVKVTGGQFDGTALFVNLGAVKIEACALGLPFGPVTSTSDALVGVLASGDFIDVNFTRTDSPDAIIDLVEEPCD